jgi:serine/threonine protein kinase
MKIFTNYFLFKILFFFIFLYIFKNKDNIVIDQSGNAIITDFGLSKEGVIESHQGAKSFCGSVAYLAPEMITR